MSDIVNDAKRSRGDGLLPQYTAANQGVDQDLDTTNSQTQQRIARSRRTDTARRQIIGELQPGDTGFVTPGGSRRGRLVVSTTGEEGDS